MNQEQYNYHINKFNEQIGQFKQVLRTLYKLNVPIEIKKAVRSEMHKIIDAQMEFQKANQPKQ